MGKETNLLCRTSSEFHRYSAIKKAEHNSLSASPGQLLPNSTAYREEKGKRHGEV